MFLSNQLISSGPDRSTGDDRGSSERDAGILVVSSQLIENTKVKCDKWLESSIPMRIAPSSG
jgi:hypothetical protein